MSSINKVQLLGNIGTAEVRELQNGNKIVNLTLATEENYKDKAGEWVNHTDWHKVVFAIPQLAERASSITKGDKIFVEGSIKYGKYTDKEGKDRYTTEIMATSFKTFLKGKKDDNKQSLGVQPSIDREAVNQDDLLF